MSRIWPTNWYGTNRQCSNDSILDAVRPPQRTLCVSYQCYSMACMDRPDLEFGDKIIMPQASFKEVHRLRLSLPLLFKLINTNKGLAPAGPPPFQFCGVLEFSAPRDQVFLPHWMMQNLFVAEGERVELHSICRPPPGTFVRFRSHDDSFLDLATRQGPKALMEGALRRYSVLTKGVSIPVQHEGNKFYLDVVEIRTSAVCTPSEGVAKASDVRGDDRRGVGCIDIEDPCRDRKHLHGAFDSVPGVAGDKRVGLVSLLGDVDLEVEFCSQRMVSSDVKLASNRALEEATGAVVREQPSMPPSCPNYAVNPITEIVEKRAGWSALPPPTMAKAERGYPGTCGRMKISDSGHIESSVAPKRLSRFRAFSGKGVVLGSASCEENKKNVEGNQVGRDVPKLEQKERMSTSCPADEAPGHVDGSGLDRGTSDRSDNDVDRIASDKSPLLYRDLDKSIRSISDSRPIASISTTGTTTRTSGGIENASWSAIGDTGALCGMCGRYVPTANRALHKLRCVSASERVGARPPQGMSQSLSATESLRSREVEPMEVEKAESNATLGSAGKWEENTHTLDDGYQNSPDSVERTPTDFNRLMSVRSDDRRSLGDIHFFNASRDVTSPEANLCSEFRGKSSDNDAPSWKGLANYGEVLTHGSRGEYLPQRQKGCPTATLPTPCPFCGLSFRASDAAAAHETLCGARTERCLHCSGHVQRRDSYSHHQPGGGCDAAIAAAIAAEEKAKYAQDVPAAVAFMGKGIGGGLHQSGYEMTKFDASLAKAIRFSREAAAALISARHTNVCLAISLSENTRIRHRCLETANAGTGGENSSNPTIKTTVQATDIASVDGESIFTSNSAGSASPLDTFQIERVNYIGSDRNLAAQGALGGSSGTIGTEVTTNVGKSCSPSDGAGVAAHQQSLQNERELSESLPLLSGKALPYASLPDGEQSSIDDSLRHAGKRSVTGVRKVGAQCKDWRSNQPFTHSMVDSVLERAPAAGDTTVFRVRGTSLIGGEKEKNMLSGAWRVIKSTSQRWACSRCTLLNTLCAKSCVACGAMETSVTMGQQEQPTPPSRTLSGVSLAEIRHDVDISSAVGTGMIPGHQAPESLVWAGHNNGNTATTPGLRSEVFASTGDDRWGRDCCSLRQHILPSLTSSWNNRSLASGRSELQAQKLASASRDAAHDNGAVVKARKELTPLPSTIMAGGSKIGAMKDSLWSQAPSEAAPATLTPLFTLNDEPSGTVGEEVVRKRMSVKACDGPRLQPIYDVSHSVVLSVQHRQDTDSNLRVQHRRDVYSCVDGFEKLPGPTHYRDTVDTVREPPGHRDRFNFVHRRHCSTSTSRPRVPGTTPAVKRGGLRLGSNHQSLRRFHKVPPVFSMTRLLDRGTASFHDALVAAAAIPAKRHSTAVVRSRSPVLTP